MTAHQPGTEDPGVGIPGPVGPPGPQGPAGPAGPAGPVGPAGPKGDTGDTGPQGGQGDQGPQGPQGDPGPAGDAGPQGAVGPMGPQGVQGDPGEAGAPGVQGDTGPQGAQGPKGDQGPQGPQGVQGVKGDTGAQGPKGDTGAPGVVDYSLTLKSPQAGSGYNGFAIPDPTLISGDPASTTNPAKRATPKARNVVGRPLMMSLMVGVIAAAQQNGHIYLEVAAGDGTANPPADGAFVRAGGVACRNNLPAGTVGNIASGGELSAVVPAGAWYRLTTEAIAGYTEPSFAYVGNPVFIAL